MNILVVCDEVGPVPAVVQQGCPPDGDPSEKDAQARLDPSPCPLTCLLQDLGHNVTEVDDVDHALGRLKSARYEIVFVDLTLPAPDGLEFCRRIRDRDDGGYTYVILVSSKENHEERWQGLEAGADDYMVTPPDPDEVRARLAVATRILQMLTTLTDTMTILEAANRRFAELYLSLPIVCMTHDLRGGVAEYNRVCEQVFNPLEMMQLQRRGWSSVCVPNDSPLADAALARAFKGERTENMEWAHPMPDGTFQYFLCSILPLHAPDGSIVAAISSHVDITKHKRLEEQMAQQLVETNWSKAVLESQKQRTDVAYAELETANERLEALAFTDGLTGLINHRAFQEQLRRECSTAARHGTSLSILLLDIDNFKGYNDTFGHQAGDGVLRNVARILEQSARGGDAVARYGGEEFVIVLPNTDEGGARITAERVRQAIEAAPWTDRAVTISIGASTLVGLAAHPTILIAMADLALYASKNAGRNRVTHAVDLPEEKLPNAQTEPAHARAA